MAARDNARVTLLHVIESIEYASGSEIDDFYESLEAQALKRMEAAAEPLREEGVSVTCQIVYGRRGPQIVRYAIEQDVDLVVLSSHRVDLQQPARGWGTLSYQVSIACQCPVLLVK